MKMKTSIFSDYSELSMKSAAMIAGIVKQKPDALLCFPAGETPVGTFKCLIEMNQSGDIDFSNTKIVGLDEWAHLRTMQNENCYNFLKKHLFDHINIKPENLCFFNGEASDLDEECKLTDDFIKKNGPIDIMVLGVGMNGHLGLNEPGADNNKYAHIVDLDNVTKNVGQKYFTKPVTLTKGITLGMKHINETKIVMLQLNGKKKSPIVKHLVNSEVTSLFPASLVKIHPDSYLFLDADAASEISV